MLFGLRLFGRCNIWIVFGLLCCLCLASMKTSTPTSVAEVVDDEELDMGCVRGKLRAEPVTGEGIAARWLAEPLRISFRQGGEQLRPDTGGRTRDLKKLLQEKEVLPWMREHIPLIYSGDKLLAVGDLWIEADCQAGADESGFRPVWSEHAALNLASPLFASRLSGNL